MKKIVLLSALFLFATALFFTACKKDQDLQTNDISNTANPYDLVGVKHNEGLAILAENKVPGQYNIAARFKVLVDHGFEAPATIPTINDYSSMLASSDPIRATYDQLKKEGKVSSRMYDAVMKLDDIVQAYAYTDELTVKMKTFEAGIATMGLTAQETKTLYVAASIARYSSHYWRVNKYEREQNNAVERMTPRSAYVAACDIAGGLAVAETGIGILVIAEAAAVASELGGNWWDLWLGMAVPNGGNGNGPFGLHWGCSSYTGECLPGHCMICDMTSYPLPLDLYTVSGPGFPISEEAVYLNLDGTKLAEEFKESLKAGQYNLGDDYAVPQDIVEKLFAGSGFHAPQGQTIFPKGDKLVYNDDQTASSTIVIPVTYEDGSSVLWMLEISR